MALDKPYKDIPGTLIFDAEQSRKGYWINQFAMSLMKAENRERFKADEKAYLDQWKLSDEAKETLLARDYNRLLDLGQSSASLTHSSAARDDGDLQASAATRRRVRRTDGARLHRLYGRRGRLLHGSRRGRSTTRLHRHRDNTEQRGRVRVRHPTRSADGEEYCPRRPPGAYIL